MAEAPVQVRQAEGTQSGLANIVQQFLEQQLEESQLRRRRARRLHGRVAMTALDHKVTVTLDFRGGEIVIWDGEQAPLQASISGPYASLVKLLQGTSNPLLAHLLGRLRVRSNLRHPFFPLRVHGLMKLPRQARLGRVLWAYALAVVLVAATATALFLLLHS